MKHQLYILQYGLTRYFKGFKGDNIEITQSSLEAKLFQNIKSVEEYQINILKEHHKYFNIIKL